MTDTLNRVLEHFTISPIGLTPPGMRRMPIEIPNVGREDLATLFGVLGFTTGVEVGVQEGAYSEVLCARNPGLHLYCVDAWLAYDGYLEYVNQAKLDGFYETTRRRLRPYGCTFLRMFSTTAAKDFADDSLDFVYLDGAHDFQHIAEDLVAWIPKVRLGGIISGHDFCRRTDQRGTSRYVVHVAEVVTAYTEGYHIAPWFLLGRKEALDGETRDRPRSFFWIKGVRQC